MRLNVAIMRPDLVGHRVHLFLWLKVTLNYALERQFWLKSYQILDLGLYLGLVVDNSCPRWHWQGRNVKNSARDIKWQEGLTGCFGDGKFLLPFVRSLCPHLFVLPEGVMRSNHRDGKEIAAGLDSIVARADPFPMERRRIDEWSRQLTALLELVA